MVDLGEVALIFEKLSLVKENVNFTAIEIYVKKKIVF